MIDCDCAVLVVMTDVSSLASVLEGATVEEEGNLLEVGGRRITPRSNGWRRGVPTLCIGEEREVVLEPVLGRELPPLVVH